MAITLCVCFGAQPATAQGKARKDLQQALKKIQGRSLRLAASIEIEQGKSDQAGAMVKMVVGSDAGRKERFAGSIEIFKSKDGSIAAVSPEGLSQVKLMHDGETSLFSQVYSEKFFDLPALLSVLRNTLDIEALSKEVGSVSRVRVVEEDSAKAYRVTIPGEFFVADDTELPGNAMQQQIMMAMKQTMEARVLEGIMTVRVDASGAAASMKFELQYNDPLKAMTSGQQGGAVAQVVIGGMGGLGGGDDGDATLGDKVTVSYEVLADTEGPAKEFMNQATEMLKSE